MKEKEQDGMAAEPTLATFSEGFRKSGLLGQVTRLSPTDKMALIEYLKKDFENDSPFQTDEFGRIMLNKDMQAAVEKAESDLENGKYLTEDTFKERFAKWF